jgi:protein O-mannosyl-transferase
MGLMASPPLPPKFPLLQRYAPILALLALTLAAYSGSFSGVIEGDAASLVDLDSRVHAFTLENLRLITAETYWSAITSSTIYRPLVTLSWLVNYAGFGNQRRALGYHVVNLAFHLIDVILAWLLILRIWGDPFPSFLAAAVFAIHPVNTEAVTNIAGRADLMAGVGVLGGLLLYLSLPEAEGWMRRMTLAGLVLASCFGFLSKENAIILPAAMLLYDLLFRSRPRWHWSAYAAVVAPILLILAWRHWVLPGLTDYIVVVDNPLLAAGFWRGRLTALVVIWRYLGLLLWPQQLSWDYSYNQIPLATVAGGIAALAGLSALLATLISLYRRAAAVCFFGIFFFLALGPTSNIALMIGSIMAERFLYLPSIGFAVCIVAMAAAICRRLMPARSGLITACLFTVILAALGTRSWARNLEWTDGSKLWDSDVLVSPNSFKTHLGRINGLYRRGLNSSTLEECIEEAKKAASIVAHLPPEQSTVRPLETLASLYALKGDTLATHQTSQIALDGSVRLDMDGTFESPRQWYEKALETFAEAVAMDDLLREASKRSALARGISRERIRFGGSSFLYSHLGDTYRRLGRFPEALRAFQHLAAIAPTDAERYEQIVQVQQAMGLTEDAIISLWQVESLRPSEADEADLRSTYRKLGTSACAIIDGKLNENCPLVKAHLCRAQTELAARMAESGLPEESAKLRQKVVDRGCGG